MEFAQNLRTIRKQAGMSQEKLAEKLGVSRQAVTKWETDAGIPDIGNLRTISDLFQISIDELLGKKETKKPSGYLYESITEYDIDEPKRYDIKLGGAKKLVFSGYDGEKIRIRLASDTMPTLQSDFKVKIDDIKKRLDVDVNRKNGVTEAAAKEGLSVFVQIPSPYIGKVELSVHAKTIELHSLECDSIELDIKTENVRLENVTGTVEINCNLDMDIVCTSLNGEINMNQVSASSRIRIPDGTAFTARTKGIGTSITYEKDKKPVTPFDMPNADNVIELNGIKSELVICTF